MKRFLAPILALALCVGLFTACNKATLQSGGAYAPTNAAGQTVLAPDLVFYQIEAGFKFSHQTVMTAFQLEYDNRALLWQIAPAIKKGLDQIRPPFNEAVLEYARARDAYKANPIPANLAGMDFWLAKLKQIAATAQAVTTDLQPK